MKNKNINKNPFNTPKGYFDSFEDNLKDKILKETAAIPKEDGFGVPASYFDQFQVNLIAKIKEEQNVTKVIPLNTYKKIMAIAASIAAITIIALSIDWSGNETLSFTDLANSDIEAYFENNELDLTTDEIADVLPIDGYEMNDFVEPELNEENLLDYLNENVENFEELNLENNE